MRGEPPHLPIRVPWAYQHPSPCLGAPRCRCARWTFLEHTSNLPLTPRAAKIDGHHHHSPLRAQHPESGRDGLWPLGLSSPMEGPSYSAPPQPRFGKCSPAGDHRSLISLHPTTSPSSYYPRHFRLSSHLTSVPTFHRIPMAVADSISGCGQARPSVSNIVYSMPSSLFCTTAFVFTCTRYTRYTRIYETLVGHL